MGGSLVFAPPKEELMKEYTLIAVISVIVTIILDKIAGTGLLRQRFFYLFLAIIAGFKFAVNGFLTGAGIVLYDPRYYLGIRLGSIPLEDFLFGFSMVTIGVIAWEWMKRKEERLL
jgi:lycopene cyclase domain-containing protein